jgi:hypothetical protein
MRVKVSHECANIASTIRYSEAYQKLEHPGEETTKATAKKLERKLTSKTEDCEACLSAKA